MCSLCWHESEAITNRQDTERPGRMIDHAAFYNRLGNVLGMETKSAGYLLNK